MKNLVLLILFSLYNLSFAYSQLRILNGQNVLENQFPWMCSIDGENCGGTLISEYWVLTAAHCVNDYEVISPNISITVNPFNKLNPKSYSETIAVDSIIYHPDVQNLNTSQPSIDVALLKLRTPSSYESIRLASSLENSWYDRTGQNAVVLGWGILDQQIFELNFQDTLKYATPEIINSIECDSLYNVWTGPFGQPTLDSRQDWEMCAGYKNGNSAQGSTTGDSGGPLIVYDINQQPLQIGVVSRGGAAALVTTDSAPGIYTKIEDVHNWIESTIGDIGITTATDVEDSSYRVIDNRTSISILLNNFIVNFFQILDMSGKIVSSSPNFESDKIFIDTSDLQGGIYILRLISYDKVRTYKFYKN